MFKFLRFYIYLLIIPTIGYSEEDKDVYKYLNLFGEAFGKNKKQLC